MTANVAKKIELPAITTYFLYFFAGQKTPSLAEDCKLKRK